MATDRSPTDKQNHEPDTDLPVPVPNTRTYIHVRPTDSALDPDLAIRQSRRLHSLDGTSPPSSRLRRLLSRSAPPTIECLIVSDGGDDTTLWYAVGVDDEELVDPLERTLRGILPNTYELDRKTRVPGFLGSLLGRTTTEDEESSTPDTQSLAAVEYRSHTAHRTDWMASLTPFDEFRGETQQRIPLASVVETMAEYEVPMVYQVLIRPKADWSSSASDRDIDLRIVGDTPWDKVVTSLWGAPEDDENLPEGYKTRREDLAERETHCSFDVNARAVAIDPDDRGDAQRAIRELASAFNGLTKRPWNRIEGTIHTIEAATDVFSAIQERRFTRPTASRLTDLLPFKTQTSPGIVADVRELPSFWLLDGAALTPAGARAVAPTPGEQTGLLQPPFDLLSNYRGPGLPIGRPETDDNRPDLEPVVISRTLQTLHLALIGATGSGKSLLLVQAILANHQATEGADILIDPKGDGMALDYLRAHYATHGNLDDVLYFNCAEVLPAISFFDIRPELDAGIPRVTAVEDVVDHYTEILAQIVGRENYDQAIRSPDIVRYLTKALFDPVSGQEAFTYDALMATVSTMRHRQAIPTVSDDALGEMLRGVVDNTPRTFDEIMQGVANRIEKVPVDSRLAAMFNHLPLADEDPHFDLERYLDEDVVIVLDTGGLRPEAQRVLTLVILSKLWTALRRRKQRGQASHSEPLRHPLVNLYIEEAANVAISDLLKRFLAQARGFHCSVTLSMQFPGQLQGHNQDVYYEILNNIGTSVVGPVTVDDRLAEGLATEAMDADEVGNRLRALPRGHWLVDLPAPFDEQQPRPFVVTSGPLPPGHPDGDRPFSATQADGFDGALDANQDRTLDEAGITLAEPSAVSEGEGKAGLTGADVDVTTRVDSALPHTNRMPPTVDYLAETHALECTECGSRYDPSIDGMEAAITCCSSLDAVAREDIPICDLILKLTPEERAACEWTDTQLLFLQAVYNVHQFRYKPLEYDLVWDSMIRLQEYVDINADAVQDLVDAGLLRHETDHPHRMYSVTPDGRPVIRERFREGLNYGHGQGDLDESNWHRFAVETARRYLVQESVPDPASPVCGVVPYYELDDQRRLDVVGLDADGDIRVAVEAERVNHDVRRAAPDDFDKMAACEPEEAIWVVENQRDGHQVLQALNSPPEGDPRVEKTYAPTTPPQQFTIDEPGFTAMYPVTLLRDRLER